jgi:hypothetical protein
VGGNGAIVISSTIGGGIGRAATCAALHELTPLIGNALGPTASRKRRLDRVVDAIPAADPPYISPPAIPVDDSVACDTPPVDKSAQEFIDQT